MPTDPKEWLPDPEFTDDADPAFRQELFEMFKTTGTKPEELVDPEMAAEYAEWLKNNP
jgi:hypothetical protein